MNLNLSSSKKLTYVSDKHSRNMITAFSSMYRNRENYDVVLNINTYKIFAHRDILSACIPYFRAMFTGNLVESQQKEITIHDMDGMAMECLIKFCYTAEIVVKKSNVQALLSTANFLQMTEVQDMCCEFLRRKLSLSNCLGIRELAETYFCFDLLRIVDSYIHSNFQEIIEKEEFFFLSVSQLISIIASDELNVSTEEQVFNAVISWVYFNLSERRKCLFEVLRHVRLPLLSPTFLVGNVQNNLLVRSDEICRDLVLDAKYYMVFPLKRAIFKGPYTRPREPTDRGQLLFTVGGWYNGDALNSVECYDPEINTWKLKAHMNKRRCGAGIAVLNNLLYAFFGFDGDSYLKCGERYNPQTNQWSCDVASSALCRSSLGVAVLRGSLYAIGGQTSASLNCSNFVERYDPIENKWTVLAPLITRRLGVAVVALGSYLYAIGGSDDQSSTLNSVERYDPKEDTWTEVTPMLTYRKHLGCAIYNGMIYAVGGRSDEIILNSAERYNPFTGVWSPINSMVCQRSGLSLAVVNDKLYAIGGYNGSNYLNTIEVYDQNQNQWSLCGAMKQKRIGGSSGVIRSPMKNYF